MSPVDLNETAPCSHEEGVGQPRPVHPDEDVRPPCLPNVLDQIATKGSAGTPVPGTVAFDKQRGHVEDQTLVTRSALEKHS